MMDVLDLFSAAAGGWSLGMHRAGYRTIAACEFVEWRRALYAQNNPGVVIYDDVRTLTAARLVRDLGRLPSVVVGSPPCQDISSANTKGKGVEGERSGLFFEAVRVIGEVRPRWFALENSANLRTRGADAVLAAMEGLGYACWAFVVRASDIGANHERPRSWLIGCDIEQVAHANDHGELRSPVHAKMGELPTVGGDPRRAAEDGRGPGISRGCDRAASRAEQSQCGDAPDANRDTVRLAELPERSEQKEAVAGNNALDAPRIGHEGGGARRHGPDGNGSASVAEGDGEPAHTDQAGQADGPLVPSLRQAQEPDDGCGSGRSTNRPRPGQMGVCEADRLDALRSRADWSLDDLANHIRLDVGLSAWVADARIAVGGPRGTSAASLIVEAFGDSVVPQIPEAIGRAILRTEAALAAVYAREAA